MPLGLRLAAVAVVAVTLAGCTAGGAPTPVPTPTHLSLETIPPEDPGTNGLEHLSGADALVEGLGAVARADGVQYTVSYRDAGGARSLDVGYSGDRDSLSATIRTADGELDVVVTAEDGFVRGTGALAARYGATAEFACRSLDDAVFGDWATVLDLHELLRTLTAGTTIRRGALEPGDPPVVDLVLEAEAGVAGSLVLTAHGEPLPIRLVLADETGSATLDVTGWDAAPADAPVACPA